MALPLHKYVFDLSLGNLGKRYLDSLSAPNRYTTSYLRLLESSVALLAHFGEEQDWPGVDELSTEHLEQCFKYLQVRPRWFASQGKSDSGLYGGYWVH